MLRNLQAVFPKFESLNFLFALFRFRIRSVALFFKKKLVIFISMKRRNTNRLSNLVLFHIGTNFWYKRPKAY